MLVATFEIEAEGNRVTAPEEEYKQADCYLWFPIMVRIVIW